MKNLLLVCLFVNISLLSFSQKHHTRKPLSKDDYLALSKSQKQTGWTLLGIGTAVTVAGILVINNTGNSDSDLSDLDSEIAQAAGGAVLIGAGITGVVIGIVKITQSGRNARKAADISFTNQRVLQSGYKGMALVSQPALTLKIHL
jgi:hypothetical protein